MGTQHAVRRERKARERAIARLAGSQHGIVSIEQLRRLGLGSDAIRKRIGTGQLNPLHRGVYAVGHTAVSRQGIWMAAVLVGPAGVHLSHRSAAALWGLLKHEGPMVELTAPCHLPHRRGLRVHHCQVLSTEKAERFGIPVTTVPRTLIDLAAVAPHRLVTAVNEAEVLGLTTATELDAAIRLNRGRRGAARLRAVADVGLGRVRSELERRFLALIAREGLPLPETGVLVKAAGELLECDCVWRDARLVVELDGRRYHDTAIAFERDRARDRVLQAEGWQAVRVTWRQLEAPHTLLADLRRLLRGRTQP